MKSRFVITGFVVIMLSCGQQNLELPESTAPGRCGEGYPRAAATDGGDTTYAVKPGEIFPCFLFETAVLGGEPIYIHFTDIYLQAKHQKSKTTSVVIVIGAANCPACALLMEDLADRAADFDGANAMMVAAVWCDNIDRTDCDFDIETAVSVVESEGWPADQWRVTNDAEAHLKPGFSDTFPTAIVIRVSDMQVQNVERRPTADGLFQIVNQL